MDAGKLTISESTKGLPPACAAPADMNNTAAIAAANFALDI
jgi:hypothetical protein